MTSKSKDNKMHRATADKLKRELTERIVSYNANEDNPIVINRAVIFGSYVNNPEREMLSDLDVGIEYGPRYEGEKQKKIVDDSFEYITMIAPSYERKFSNPLFGKWDAARRFMAIGLRGGSHYISIHRINEDAAIFDKKVEEIDVGEIVRSVE